MTIRPGTDWGERGALAPGAPVFDDDRTARHHLQERFDLAPDDAATELGEIGLVGGDLHRSLGSPRHSADDLHAGVGTRFLVDVGIVTLDGRELVFLSHLVAHAARRRRWWSRRTVVVMNATHLGDMNLGPRAHPNDGRLDLTDGVLPLGQRRQGRRRARSGTHVPHPALRTRSSRRLEVEDPAPLHTWLDGEYVGAARQLSIRCVPDALTIVV